MAQLRLSGRAALGTVSSPSPDLDALAGMPVSNAQPFVVGILTGGAMILLGGPASGGVERAGVSVGPSARRAAAANVTVGPGGPPDELRRPILSVVGAKTC